MSAISTLGMTPARRRIFMAGLRAADERLDAARVAHEKEVAAWREAQRTAIEAAIARESDHKQKLIRAARARHPVSGIIAEVALKHGITAEDITSESRSGPIVQARQEAMWRARQETDLSLPALGRRFGGRDHTTVLYGIRHHQARLDGTLYRPNAPRVARRLDDGSASRARVGEG